MTFNTGTSTVVEVAELERLIAAVASIEQALAEIGDRICQAMSSSGKSSD